MANATRTRTDTGANLGFEAKLWQAADALRNNMDAAEYKHVVLGLIFLKYISDAFEATHAELEADRAHGADPEDPDEYRAATIFWVPKEARWTALKAAAPQPTIGTLVDDAMAAIERDNPSLKGVLPKDYARPGLDKARLGQLINLVSDIALGAPADRAKDTLGRVYEYFLAQFASAEGKQSGQFYTPRHVVRVLVEMLAPYKGRVYDPCCGSGGMFVQSERVIEAHAGRIGDISIYGQESNYTTWRLAKMNLAIRGIDAQIAHGDTFHNDRHPDLKADYVLANPPFNDSDWRGDLLRDDRRWVYGVPPAGNANFAWVQHFISHLAPTGTAGFVLTGFDAPSLHTMYLDKPMRGHGLMQAIARVNRVFRDKPGGLVVDYLGIADELRRALAAYTESGGTGEAALDQAEAVALMLEKHEICAGLFHGFDHRVWITGDAEERLALLPAAQEHILAQEDGKARLLQAVTELSAAFALSVPADEALAIRDDVGFYQAVRAVLAKSVASERRTDEQLDHAIRQIVSQAIVSDEVIDIFAAAGLRKPDISILSDEFLAEVRALPQRNVAVELLRKLLAGEIKSRGRRNVVQARSFADLLGRALRRYQNRAIETAQVIEELIALAKEIRQASARGEALGLTDDELAFYDALETNDSAVAVLGEPELLAIARELTEQVRANVTIDWTVRENVRAQLRVLVKRILRKHGYPPDKQARATELVLEQAEVLSELWAVA